MPKPKQLVIKSAPLQVDDFDFEDFLATDDLFVEYFNQFLQLPTFPEPLAFNKETSGFEVINNAQKDLAQQIKSAVRSSKRPAKIYRAAKNHSFRTIPLIPMEVDMGPDVQEIDTSFTVKTLNKEQGIHWIKAERLPSFLKSDCYHEYRLASILSQVKIATHRGDPLRLKVNHDPRPAKTNPADIEPEPEPDLTDVLMKDMFVSMGNATTSQTQAWVTQAQMALEARTTSSLGERPASVESELLAKSGVRPYSAFSGADSMRSSGRRVDSGIASRMDSPSKLSGFDESVIFNSVLSLDETEDEELISSRLYNQDSFKPTTPRPSENVCSYVEENRASRTGGRVYVQPKPEEKDDDKDSVITENNEQLTEPATPTDKRSVVVESLEELGQVVVGTVLKTTVARISGLPMQEILEDYETIRSAYPSRFHDVTVDQLDYVTIALLTESYASEDDNDVDIESSKKADSDHDSLLASDDDYEEADTFFRQHKAKKPVDLKSKSSIDAFKSFLQGTVGERYWNLWLDIDRGSLLKDRLNQMSWEENTRDKYERSGGVYELNRETKASLSLVKSDDWLLDNLIRLQGNVVEPLLTYWSPRFLIQQTSAVNPDKNPIYFHQRRIKSAQQRGTPSFPYPKIVTKLPLRPKTCQPRIKQIEIDYSAAGQSVQKSPRELPLPVMVPAIPQRRTFAMPTLLHGPNKKHLHPAAQEFYNKQKQMEEAEKARKKELLTATLSSQHSTPAETPRRPTSAAVRPQSVAPSIRSRPSSAAVNGGTYTRTSRPGSGASPSGTAMVPEPPTEEKPASRPQSAKSDAGQSKAPSETKSNATDESIFLGGRRMEKLLEVLHNEGKAGQFLRDYVKTSDNKVWLSCMDAWQDVQDYHKLFFNEVFDEDLLRRKARHINSRYVAVTGSHYVQCGPEITKEVRQCLEPPYEDLFDSLEEYIIGVLHEVFAVTTISDKLTYSKVELIDVTRHLETKNKYVINLQRRGLIKERPLTPDLMEGYKDPEYDPALFERIPEEYRDFSLDKLIHHRIELEHFRQFLSENYASTDLMCWMDIESFRRLSPKDDKRREMKAKDIRLKYLNKKYFFGPNSPAGKEGQEKVMDAGGGWGKLLNDRPPTESILEAQRYVQERLEKKWLPLFLASEAFNERQKLQFKMEDAAEDMIIQRRKRSQHIYKMLESKFVSSSRDIIQFRKGLQNPITSFQFRRFVSIKGETLENDVLFWQEVQRYKELYHLHSEDAFIHQKVMAIINCFIDSQIPPSLQIDIAPEQAENIIERRRELGPYLFREAQLTVFRILFNQWNDFCEYRANIGDDSIMPTIERQRRRTKIKERARLKKEEEKAEREAARRRKLGLPPEGDDDAFHDPFHDTRGGDDDASEDGADDKITWSYAKYMSALDRDNVINNTDESTFSSLSDSGSVKDGSVVGQNEDNLKIPPKPEECKSKKSVKNNEKKSAGKKVMESIPGDEDKFKLVSSGDQTPPRSLIEKKKVLFADGGQPRKPRVSSASSRRPSSASNKDINDNNNKIPEKQDVKGKGKTIMQPIGKKK